MRKCNRKFQAKRSGVKGMPALASNICNDKTWQLAASYGLMNLLRRVGQYWLPRNTLTASEAGGLGSRRFVQALQDGREGSSAGYYTPKVINNYVRNGVHTEAA